MPDGSPIWDLKDLYAGMDDPALATDLASARKDAVALAVRWQGKLAKASGAELAMVIAEYERIFEIVGKVQSHAQLLFAANTIDAAIAKHHQSVREAGAEINATLLFVELETAVMDDAHVADLMKTAECAHWQPWLRRVRGNGTAPAVGGHGAHVGRACAGRTGRLGSIVLTKLPPR